MDRISEKIEEIEQYVDELESFLPPDFDTYETDVGIKAICERYIEKIVEAVVDLAFLIIKKKKLKSPEDDKRSFDILANNWVISTELAKKLKEAKGMRNIIAHEYGKINDKLVFEAVTEELIKDVEEFIKSIA